MPAPERAHRLLLLKHSLPLIDPAQPADTWPLSDEGRLRAVRLAERLMAFRPQALYTSPEIKAAQTAAILGERLSLTPITHPALHEHLRRSAAFSTQDAFEQDVMGLFSHPNRLVFGDETARQAQQRFNRAVEDISAAHPSQIVAIVAHGTVISLYLSGLLGWEATETFRFWKGLGLPGGVSIGDQNLEVIF